MYKTQRIQALVHLGSFIKREIDGVLEPVILQSIVDNPWFTESGVKEALRSIARHYLDEGSLKNWLSQYETKDENPMKVGLILAGNIPMVGFHDIMCTFLTGHVSIIKYSSKDKVLLSYLIAQLSIIDPKTASYFTEVERLAGFDAVIATGGSTAATHFEYYFSKYPHIIRKNRSSVAVLTGHEDVTDLQNLGKDMFTYFGLGCRNVSKIFVPQDYQFDKFFEAIIDYQYIIDHHKYKNNYDYSNAIYLLGQHPFLTNNFLIVREDRSISSRIACVHYERYHDVNLVVQQLGADQEQLQCIASLKALPGLPFTALGQCQSPGLSDYADQVDTMQFLNDLHG